MKINNKGNDTEEKSTVRTAFCSRKTTCANGLVLLFAIRTSGWLQAQFFFSTAASNCSMFAMFSALPMLTCHLFSTALRR